MTRLFAIAFLVLASHAHAGDKLVRPQFRGPNGAGVADTQKPPIEFGPDKNVKWKVPAPPGLSSPIVAGDKLVITAFDGGKLYTVAYDAQVKDMVARAAATFGRLDVLVNNAGISGTFDPDTLSTPAWDRLMAVNAKGVFLGMKHAIPAMQRSGGGASGL